MKKKILMVSIPSIHFFRWTYQLKDSGFEVFWFDITGSGIKNEQLNWVTQIVDWKLRLDFPGRYLLKSKLPKIYKIFQKFNERSVNDEFEKLILKIKPDIVHSFALHISCLPILNVMSQNLNLKWIYSSWGSDLFYNENKPNFYSNYRKAFKRINFLITDCRRDYLIAKSLGFKGDFLGVFPGGGGFNTELIKDYIMPLGKRRIILIKGYQNNLGRGVNVLKALLMKEMLLKNYKIVIFSAEIETLKFIEESELKKWNNLVIQGTIGHTELLKLMGKSLIYVGNSTSDGIPNTLLESILMGAFPIQSNPGNVTEEVILNYKNGILIENCEDINEISKKISYALNNHELLQSAFKINVDEISQKYEYSKIKNLVLNEYNKLF